MTSLMTPSEREQLEIVSRVLRIHESKEWLSAQTRRLRSAFKRVPIVGAIAGVWREYAVEAPADSTDRGAIAASYFEGLARRQAHEVQRAVRSSAFWDEVRRWAGLEPGEREFTWDAGLEESVKAAADDFDRALTAWNAKVETECRGLSPNIKGAIGVGAIALAVVLIAVPGPISALTFVAAKGAMWAALTQLATAAGAGGLLGKHMGRLMTIVYEKLLGSPEFDAVHAASDGFRGRLESVGRTFVDEAVLEATALVMPCDDPLASALGKLREPPEVL